MAAACWVCDKTPHASCRFCGRFICKDHASRMPYILTMYVGAKETLKAVIVADAIWCGICRPQGEPIEMPEFY